MPVVLFKRGRCEMEGYEIYFPKSHGPDIATAIINLLDYYHDQEAMIAKDPSRLSSSNYFRGMRALGDVMEGLHAADRAELSSILADLGEISKEYKKILNKAMALHKENLSSLMDFGGKLRECEKQIKELEELELKCS
jgi:hypothetical protein